MDTLTGEIGSFDAKTRLAELLREVEQGRAFTITRRGRPVARLVPFEPARRGYYQELAEEFRALRESIKGPIDVKALIEDGRRC